MTLSFPSWICERTAPIAAADASVASSKGSSKLGYANIGSVVSAVLNVSKADCSASPQVKGFLMVSFFVFAVRGFAILLYR